MPSSQVHEDPFEDDVSLESVDKSDELKIHYILATNSMKESAWKKLMLKMNTQEIVNGSMFVPEDREQWNDDDVFIERFLIKWHGLSYLHVSWETYKDLLDECGTQVKTQVNRFLSKMEVRERESRFRSRDIHSKAIPNTLHSSRRSPTRSSSLNNSVVTESISTTSALLCREFSTSTATWT